jgi:hypothetical protein
MGKNAKKSETTPNFRPGWIGGRLTSPAAYDQGALKQLKKRMEAMVAAREAMKAAKAADPTSLQDFRPT